MYSFVSSPLTLPCENSFIHFYDTNTVRWKFVGKFFHIFEKKKKKLSLLELHFVYEIGNKVGYRRSKRL